MTYRFRAARTALARDPGHLPLRDRAVLRILNRTGAATAAQLTTLAYRNRRLAQDRLRRLWTWGYLERTTLPPAGTRGGAPYAYRLAPAATRRLGYRRTPWRGPGYLAHTLDAVEAVCAIVRSTDPETRPIVALWLPESIAGDLLPGGPLPDAVIVLESGTGPAVVCLEIDEHTQHRTPIRDKLAAYSRALDARPGWHVLFVVPSPDRARWLRRVGRDAGAGEARAWVTTLDELRSAGAAARLAPIAGQPSGTAALADLATGPAMPSTAPVGTVRWLEVLGSGGSETTA